MYELNQVGEKSYYINCPAKIGVYLADDKNVYLIDSGNDKDAGIPMLTISAEISICSSRQGAKFLEAELKRLLQSTLF